MKFIKIIKKSSKTSKNEPKIGTNEAKKRGKKDQNGPNPKWSKMVENGQNDLN